MEELTPIDNDDLRDLYQGRGFGTCGPAIVAVIEGETVQHIRNSIAQGFDNEPRFRDMGKKHVDELIDFLNSHNIDVKDKTIVEVGCGAGRMTEFLAKKFRLVYATDIASGMLYRLEQRLGVLPNVKLLCSDNLSLIPNESTDIILSTLVFQHNPESLVKKFFEDGYRILKPEGYYVFQLSVKDKHEVVQKNHATDMVRWTADELTEIANEHGYKILNKLDDFLKIWQKI
jgi:ubiquinone/menaquinone biosynthesis C-methylase UbiE